MATGGKVPFLGFKALVKSLIYLGFGGGGAPPSTVARVVTAECWSSAVVDASAWPVNVQAGSCWPNTVVSAIAEEGA